MSMAKQNFKRVYHHYLDWEEIDHNMWGVVDNKDEFIEATALFMENHHEFGRYMVRVTKEWPISCENALTDPGLNKVAWIGQAACALAKGSPESITRKSWSLLSNEQRLLANKEANKAIKLWEDSYIKDRCLCKDVGGPMLF